MKRTVFFVLFFFLVSFIFAQENQLKVNGYLSAEYIHGQEDTDYPDGTFQNPQLGLLFSGMLVAKVNYTAEVVLRQNAGVDLNQVLLGLAASEAFAFNLGLFLVPFGKYNQNSRAHQTSLVEPPLNVKNLYPFLWRDVGLQVEGVFSGLIYSIYLGNGLAEAQRLEWAQQFKDNNANKAVGALAIQQQVCQSARQPITSKRLWLGKRTNIPTCTPAWRVLRETRDSMRLQIGLKP